MSAKAKNKLTPQQRKATLNRVLHKIRPYSAFVVCSLLVAAVSVAAQLYIPILCGDAIDKMLGKGNVDLAGVLRIAVSILVVAAVAALAQWLLSVCNNRITFSVSRDLRNEALRKIQTLPLSYLDSHPSGDIVSRMVADVDTFADGLLMGFTQLFSGILTIFGTLLFMLRENVPITLVVVCITPLSLVVAGFLAKRSYGYFQSQSTVRGKQTALVNEMIEGQKVVQAFGHEAESLAAFDEVNGQLQDVSLKAIFFSSLTNPATRFVNNIVYAGVGLVGALYAVRGGITIGQLSVFLSYANQYTKPFNEISGVVTELQNALACAARVFELLDAEDQVPEAENAAALQPDGHVQLQDVSFRYLPDRPLIEGLSLDVQPGQRIAIVGPTGCGKTMLAQTLAKILNVPFAVADATSLTEAGYVGEDVENILLKLIQAADYDVELAERGIIYVDEIDKIARKSDNPSITRDVSGEGVQQGLLKLLEGSIVNVPPQGGRKHPDQKMIPVNTKNILYICGGAFDGIERKIAMRLNTHVVGYNGGGSSGRIDRENLLQYIAPQDLKSFGLIPEIIGRLPILTYLQPLDKAALRRILVEPKNSIIKQYIKLFEMDGVRLSFDEDMLDYVVEKAVEFKLGARGLRSIVETIMMDAMYETPSSTKKKLHITRSYAEKKLEKAKLLAV